MRISQLPQKLEYYIQAKIPSHSVSAPGIGKTQVHEQVARKREMGFLSTLLTQYDAVDVGGFPAIRDGKTVWSVPDFLDILNGLQRDRGSVLWLLDEMLNAHPSVQIVANQLLLESKVRNHSLPPKVHIAAASNRVGDKTHVYHPPLSTANRVAWLEIEPNLDDFITYAIRVGFSTMIIQCLKNNPKLLHYTMDGKEQEQYMAGYTTGRYAVPTPRTWEFVDRLLKSGCQDTEAIGGCVGMGAATTLIAYIKFYEQLPDIDELFAHPESIKIPTEPSVLYMLVDTLVQRADKKNLSNVAAFIKRLTNKVYKAYFYKSLLVRDEGFYTTKEFVEFINSNPGIL